MYLLAGLLQALLGGGELEHKHVGALEVIVHDLVLMEVGQTLGNLGRSGGRKYTIQRLA